MFLPHIKHLVAITKADQSMLFRYVINTECENYTKHVHALCGQY